MAETKWTPAQKKAINCVDGSLIVSAAAGSGKTAVLIERIINRVCDENKPCSVDRLLMVTFTKAAAREMREKLDKALSKRISLEPDNKWLVRQQMLLPLAQIGTIDQFFNNLVKENYHLLDIAPDFNMLDESEKKLLQNEACEEILEQMYDSGSDEFASILDIFSCERDDGKIADYIINLFTRSQAYPDADSWLNSIAEVYQYGGKPQDTVFGEYVLKTLEEYIDYIKSLYDSALAVCGGLDGFDGVRVQLLAEKEQADYVLVLVKAKKWNEIIGALNNLVFDRFAGVKGEYKQSPEKDYVMALRTKAKSYMGKLIDLLPANEAEFVNDTKLLYPVIKELVNITFAFRERYCEKKAAVNSYDFDDITHFALSLVCDKAGAPTLLATEIQEKYDEILIDEYQDTNEAQDKIFSVISKNESNLFLVGDVKQSIYGFRLAMPQVFLNRMKCWKNNGLEYPMAVNLDRNFRSRADILECTNYLFRRIMSERTGDMVYNDDEALKPGADYPMTDEAQVEFDILEKNALPEDYSEAQFIADRIKQLIASEMPITLKDGTTRKIKHGDICVLMRSVRDMGMELADLLKSQDVPVYIDDKNGFFENTEISVMLSFLSIIDNPLQDVPLMSVLMSPLFGFSADDVAKVRVGLKNTRLYYALQKSDMQICKDFLKTYGDYRKLSTVVNVHTLIRTIYDDSSYLSIASALPNGESRKLNLMLLLEYAKSYEEFDKTGLSGFIRYIDRLKKNENDLKPASSVSEYADVVRIMTVHNSKGLEFPVVFLSNLSKARHRNTSDIVYNSNVGIGLKVSNSKRFIKYSTVQFAIAKELDTLREMSEELRVLYVAMTRAKEKLIMTCTVTDAAKAACNAQLTCQGGKINSVAVENSQSNAELIMSGLFLHPDFQKLRKLAGFCGDVQAKSNFNISLNIINEVEADKAVETVAEHISGKVDANILNEINNRTSYVYPFSVLTACPTKRSASSFNESESDFQFFACDVPRFSQPERLTSANKGTAMHRFMECCDYENAVNNLENEIERLVNDGRLTAQQADVLNRKSIVSFFESRIFKRIQNAEKVFREQQFTVFVPLSLAQPELSEIPCDERVLVQGVIDCAFIENGNLVVLDYKTDYVKSTDELVSRYHRQLEVYKYAAQQLFGAKVGETLLYSFALNEEKQILS